MILFPLLRMGVLQFLKILIIISGPFFKFVLLWILQCDIYNAKI